MLQKIIHFFTRDIWRFRSKKLPRRRFYFLRFLRIFIVSLREFSMDKCSLRASALTFWSLLSVVPVVAMAFGFAKGFGMEKLLKAKLLENAVGQEEIINRIFGFAENLLENTKGGIIAGIGIAILFWTVINVLGNIETSFNDIWGVKKHRTLSRKFSDYLSLMLICPVMFILASSATVFIASQATVITEYFPILAPAILFSLKFLPFAVIGGMLTFIYIVMPNTRIHFKSALLGGIVAGVIYQVVQWAYIHFQIGVTKANAVYGSLAALPLFLAWVQMSWLIVLYGAELAFAHQNETTYEFEPDCLAISRAGKKILALRVTELCVKRFCTADRPLTEEELSDTLEIPIRLLREILFQLVEAGVLTVIQEDDEKKPSYQPARDVEHLTVKEVMDLLDKHGFNEFPFMTDSPELKKIRNAVHAIDHAGGRVSENVPLKIL